VLDQRFILLVMVAPSLSWLIMRRFRLREPRVPSTRGEVGLVRSRRLLFERLALHGAAISLTAFVWAGTGIFVVMASLLVLPGGSGSNLFGDLPEDLPDVAQFALDLAAVWVVLVFFMSGMSAMNRLARRLRVVAAGRYQGRPPRPVLLYLRAFDDDPRMLAAGDFGLRSANEIFSFRARVPFEEVVARELNRHGLVVAIAEPGTPMLFLPLGASRKRLSQREWQEAVRARMRGAALIIIAVGTTEGLLWEVATATRQGLLDRVLLIVPPNDDDEVRARWRTSAQAITAAGGPTLDLPVDPAATLVVRVGPDGLREAVVADRRDEHTYATAIARTVAGYRGLIPRDPWAAMSSTLPGSSAPHHPGTTPGHGPPGGATGIGPSGSRFSPLPQVPAGRPGHRRTALGQSKLAAGLLGIFLGWLGAGRFYIGDSRTGVRQLVITFLTCGLGWVWGLIDGIVILVNGGHDAQGRKLRDR